ncbi:MAG: type II toxin-antitoxin system HicB family antitoxin [Petrimonas sp.]|nr:type II toxin-antitoxin system HicB family antitoxin [Petrimonas sp.]
MKTDNKYLKYKGYIGSVEFSLEDNILFGKVLGIPSLLSYEGETLESLKKDFEGAVSDYLNYCKQENIKPEKPNFGSLNIRLGTNTYFKAVKEAQRQGISLNRYINRAVETAVNAM